MQALLAVHHRRNVLGVVQVLRRARGMGHLQRRTQTALEMEAPDPTEIEEAMTIADELRALAELGPGREWLLIGAADLLDECERYLSQRAAFSNGGDVRISKELLAKLRGEDGKT